MRPDVIAKKESGERAGFTRTDLLVVIAVLAILALPLVAVTTRDQAMAQQLKCASNLKQLMVQSLLYAADNEKLVSYSVPTTFVTGSGILLFNQYDSNTTNLLMCPAAPKSPLLIGVLGQGSADQYWIKNAGPPLMVGSVGFNGWFFSDRGGDGSSALPSGYFTNVSQVSQTANTPVFFDANWVDTWPMETDFVARDLYQGNTFGFHGGYEMGRLNIVRHGALSPVLAPRNLTGNPVLPGEVNMGFFDGHVEPVRLENLWTLNWYSGIVPLAKGHPPAQ